jgi:hypothetical protein
LTPLDPKVRAAAIRDAWLVHKRLRYKLYPHQQRAYDAFKALIHGKKTKRRMAWRWSRRIGKSFAAQVLSVETCIQVPGARIAVISPTEKVLEEFVKPALEAIIADAPPEVRPRWSGQDNAYLFDHNGSRIALYGAANDAAIDNIGRGPAAHGVVFEEAGHIRDLAKARKVVAPQLLGTRGMDGCGWMLFVGTPPESTTHPFVQICRAAREEGREVHYTIHDGHWPPETVRTFIEEEAEGIPYEEFITTEDYRREFLAELIGDPTRKVLKFADEARLKACVERYKATSRPSHFKAFEGMDVGWSPDWTFWLLAWWDYRSRTLVVEKELHWRDGFKHEDMAAAIKAAETEVLGAARVSPFHVGYKVPQRWSDYSPILLAELADKHDIIFNHTAKDDRDTAISNCDRMIPGYGSVGKLAINPACKELLKQMEAALWNKARTDFAKDAPKRYGHYDGVAALVYLTRNVIRDENPFPPDMYAVDRNTHFVVDEGDYRHPEDAAWARAFGVEEDAA